LKGIAKRSFSLVEILVSLSILLIITVITIPRFFNFDDYHLRNELDHLFVVASYLQQRAIACCFVQKIMFNVNENSYIFEIDKKHKTHVLHKNLQFGFLHSALGSPGEAKNSILQAISFNNRSEIPIMRFFSDGKATQGTVYIANKKKNIMGAFTSSVSPVSCLRKYMYKNDRWEHI
jgi:Tfp pilus assembly protein FimT